MTTPMLMTEHPTEELLAEYIDNRLDATNREPVTDHLATCGECREIMLMSMAFQESEKKVVHGNFGGRGWMAAIGGLAAAASVVVVIMLTRPSTLFGPKVDDLVVASAGLPRRVSDGRFAGGFAHSEKPRTDRGDGKNSIDYSKAKLYRLALDAEEAKWSGPHIRGLSRLLIADKRDDVRDAVAILETAHQKARGQERYAVATDLAAALIASARWSGHEQSDHARALELSNEVLKRQPQNAEALWNRAVALASLNRDDEALRAFDDYLKVDSTSKWAEEARERKANIESFR